MGVVFSKPPLHDNILDAANKTAYSWKGWFTNLYDRLHSNHEILDRKEASNSPSIAFSTNLSSRFLKYRLELSNLTFSAATSVLYIQVSVNRGASYASGASDYGWGIESAVLTTGPTVAQSGDLADTQIKCISVDATNDATNVLNGHIEIFEPASSKYKQFGWDIKYNITGGDLCQVRGIGQYNHATAISAVKIYMSSGNIVSGKITLIGLC